MSDKISKLFKGRELVIATMHEKERVIAPILENQLGVKIIVPKNFNSDKFGTFTREIKRAGNQLEAARAKAYAAMSIEGVDLGVASEGSFGPHPSIPFVKSSLELILLIDKKNNYEVRGHYRASKTNLEGQYVKTLDEVVSFARKIGFPRQGIILRKNENKHNKIYKNIQTEEELIEKAKKMLGSIFTSQVFVETDMRAHRNPDRMKGVEEATKDLIKNINSHCPKCKTPGFVIIDFEKGLKCSLCNHPTDLPIYDIYECGACKHKEKKPTFKNKKTANPQYCKHCNP